MVSIRGFSQVEDNTTDNGDGTYNVAFTVPGPSGVYKVAVMEDGVPLKGSPFKLKVKPASNPYATAQLEEDTKPKKKKGGKKAAAKKAAKKEAKAAAVASSPSPAAKKVESDSETSEEDDTPGTSASSSDEEKGGAGGSEKKKSMLQKGVEKGKAIAGMMSSKKK